MANLGEDINKANRVAAKARLLRENLRWEVPPGDETREAQITEHLALIDEAMKPIRSTIGRLAWITLRGVDEQRLRVASQALQYERKQLKKMRRG